MSSNTTAKLLSVSNQIKNNTCESGLRHQSSSDNSLTDWRPKQESFKKNIRRLDREYNHLQAVIYITAS
jgi:hypothetical protein